MKPVLRKLEIHAGRTHRSASSALGLLAATAVFCVCFCGQAIIVGPYTPDANTLHLWHLDEGAAPAVDSAPGGTNLLILAGGATLNNASFTGFGTALNTLATTNAYLAPLTYTGNANDNVLMTYADTNTGAFTCEAIIRIDFDPATFTYGQPLYLVTAENLESGSQRPWQWAILPNGTSGTTFRLRFFAGGSAAPNNITFAIPTTGPDAIAQGNWYHVAVTFSGGAASGTLKQYWTLLDSGRVQANLIGSATMNNLSPKATGAPAFQIGNVGRGNNFSGFRGLMDEVRLSNIERPAGGMMFNPPANVVIVTPPVSQIAAVGQPVTFSVAAVSSITPLSYQWRFNTVPIAGATDGALSIASAQLTNAGSYDVIVTNSVSAATSDVATLTVRLPLQLTWLGSTSADWDTNAVNWDTNADLAADSSYTQGDHVRFNNDGLGNPIVSLTGVFTPSSVTVNADPGNDYLLTTAGSGAIAGNTGLTKQGENRLVADTDNTYTGPTLISGGVLQVGNGGARGSLGTGPVTNNVELRFDRTGTLTMDNSIAGAGALTKSNTLSLRLLGPNTFSGPVTLGRGNLTVGPAGLGSATNLSLFGAGTGDGTSLTLRDGTSVGPAVNLTCYPVDANNRAGLVNEAGTNVFNGAILLSGAGPMIVRTADGALEVNGPITGDSFTDVISFRGVGTNNIVRSRFHLPNGGFQKDDAGTWLFNSSSNLFAYARMLAGTLKLGNADALATNGAVRTDGGTLDLAGFNQTVSGLANFRATPVTTIANSSISNDSRLSVLTAPADPPWISGCIIADATAGGTRKVSLTLAGGATLVFTNASTYSGDTTVGAGTLALSGNGAILNTTPIDLAAGATLDASARSDATLTLGPGQTLKGNTAFNVLGNLTNHGTIELKLNKAGATLTNDNVNGLTAIVYGGTLKLNITASPALTTGDSFKLLSAGSYAGAFANLVPAAPVFGLAWDTSTLATDGTLRIKPGPATNPTNITGTVVGGGGTLQLEWPADHVGWTLQAQTNSLNVGLSTNWFNVPGSAGTNQAFMPIDPTKGSGFYRLVYP
jgi:autotransporter-associated beta strand protein